MSHTLAHSWPSHSPELDRHGHHVLYKVALIHLHHLFICIVIFCFRSGWFQFEFDVEMLSFDHLLILVIPVPYFEWRSGQPCSTSSIGNIIVISFNINI